MRVAGFIGKPLKDALWIATRATTVNSFTHAMQELRKIYKEALSWLVDKHLSEWSRSHFTCTAQSDMLVNNICESFNAMIKDARNNALINCLEIIRKQIMVTLYERKHTALKWTGSICPAINAKIVKLERQAGGHLGHQSDDFVFEIRGMYEGQHRADLENKSCTCRRWELTGIPCKHTICAIWLKNDKCPIYDFVKTYAGFITPLASYEEWPTTSRDPLLPPLYTAKPGRPRKLRKRFVGELTNDGVHLSRKFANLHCTICKSKGHNKRKCPQRIVNEVQLVVAEDVGAQAVGYPMVEEIPVNTQLPSLD